MTEKTTSLPTLTKSQFFNGFFAALLLVHGKTLRAKTSELHSAFHQVFSTSEVPAFRKVAESTSYTYDLLYGQSDWLDSGVSEANRDLLIDLPLSIGRWNDIDIRFNREEAKQRLDKLGLYEEFVAFANAFVTAFRIGVKYNNFFPSFMAGIFVSGGRYWSAPRRALLPAFRHALTMTHFPVPAGYPVDDVSEDLLSGWLDNGLTYLRQIELVESNSNVFICDYRVKMTPETAETALRASEMRNEFATLGKTFLDHLAAIPSRFGSRWGVKEKWTAVTDPR
jgi:hypothetical protein